MRPYSQDLRERAVAAVERGMARSDVVAVCGVSLASLKRWVATNGPAQETVLRAQLAAHPDAPFGDHAHLWKEHQGARVRRSVSGRSGGRAGG